ncbi:hypothetical protein LRS10_04255 [Phenylobacterium sp. J426]|uniref:hypothetical protein n=1 Tax=Phenylobacterium sp. J426 TaxID=2898439 RepID=UPI002151DBD9|nr:hypothetical protein [Phenylobacterium sp. J426]MCR5873467.1 hypothetical protein [Phenylobacterium sp. J426]
MIRRPRAPRWALLLAGSAMALSLPPLAHAQAPSRQAAPADEAMLDEEGYEVDELVVTAAREIAPRGSVVGVAEPEIVLDQREIRALGVGSVTELLAALEPQLASGRGRAGGRPIILLNGQRISSFREVRDLPPEAIVRMEILPEEVALRYGYRADQRVVNFVLRRRFRAITVETGVTLPTAGGQESYDATVDGLLIGDDARQQVNLKAGLQTPLLESQRNVVRIPDETAFRTLVSRQENLSLNAIYARPLGEGVSATLNGSLEWTDSTGRLGQDPGALDALRRLTDSNVAHLGGTVNGAVSGWRWTLTGNADWSETQTTTEVAYDPVLGWRAPNTARSTVTSADVQGLVNGTLFDLPAGAVNAAFTVAGGTQRVESQSFRLGTRLDTDLDRQTVTAQANFDAPLASRRRGGIEGLGDLSVNFNANVEHYSDFGSLYTLGGGVTWSPIQPVRLIASFTDEDGAPTIQQLGNPEIITPNVRVFDFTTGQTVEVAQATGGNPDLAADNRQVLKLGLTIKPFDETDLTFRADYTRTRTRDEIASFPAITPEIEAAFPDRIVRDALTNQLVRIDTRPVNFDRHDEQQLRWGFNYSRPIRNTRTPAFAQPRPQGAAAAEGAPPAEGPPRGEGGGRAAGGFSGGAGGFGPGGGRRGGFGGGNLQFAVFHTWRIEDEVLIRPGVPVLDLLGGSALTQGGGTPKHQVDVQAGVSRNGLGARLNARWQQGTEVDGGAGDRSLRFSDLTTVDLRLFADLGLQPMARSNPWMRGARVSLNIDNVFDQVRTVRDEAGLVPLTYQPDLIDPLGRTVRVSFRKLFLPRRAVPPPGQGQGRQNEGRGQPARPAT